MIFYKTRFSPTKWARLPSLKTQVYKLMLEIGKKKGTKINGGFCLNSMKNIKNNMDEELSNVGVISNKITSYKSHCLIISLRLRHKNKHPINL